MLKVLYTKVNGTLTADISSVLTLLPLDLATIALLQANVNFAGGEWTYLKLDNGTYSEEVKVTSVSGSYAVVVRGPTPMAFSYLDTTVSDVVGVDAIKDIVAGTPVVSSTTVTGTGLATVVQTGNNYNVNVAALNLTSEANSGIAVMGTYPNLTLALELDQGGCCPGEGTSTGTGLNSLVVNSTILQGTLVGAVLTLTLQTPVFTGAGTVAVTGTWPNYTITGAGGAGTGTVTSVAVGDGLSLTGNPAVNPTISMANTGVTAGDYGGFVVNARGQITQIPLGFNPISSIAVPQGATVSRVGGAVTITLDSADIAVPGIVALADHTQPVDSADVQKAVTPALLAAALGGVGQAAAIAGSGTGEADALYTNIISTTTVTVDLAAGEKAMLLGEVTILDGTAPLTPVAFGIGVFDAANVKRHAGKKMTQSSQSILGFINGPYSGALTIVTTAVPAGATVQSAFLAAIEL